MKERRVAHETEKNETGEFCGNSQTIRLAFRYPSLFWEALWVQALQFWYWWHRERWLSMFLYCRKLGAGHMWLLWWDHKRRACAGLGMPQCSGVPRVKGEEVHDLAPSLFPAIPWGSGDTDEGKHASPPTCHHILPRVPLPVLWRYMLTFLPLATRKLF